MKKERFVWLRLVIVVVPLLSFLIFVNCYFDPANLFHDVSKPIADSLMEGNPTFITSGNMNERLVKQYMIESMPDRVDCITVGSSTVFGIRKEHVGTEKYYNLGVSSGDFYDIMSQFALLEINEKQAERIIFCVDSYFFDEVLYESFTRNTPWRPYANYMMKVLDGDTPEIPKLDTKAEQIERFKQMFSVTYFQSSIDYIVANGSLNIPRWGVPDKQYEGTYYLPDGSMVYAKSYEDTTLEEALKNAENYDLNYHFTAHGHISEKSKQYFEKLIVHLIDRGIEVDLFLCPVSPALWDRYDECVYPILSEVEAFIYEMADEYGIEVEGSYNPNYLNIPNEAFYDARHIRHGLLEEYFNFF